MIQVPITNDPNQVLSLTIPKASGNLQVTLAVSWNAIAGYWQMNITDASRGLLLSGLPLITGQPPAHNLLGQYSYLGLGKIYILRMNIGAADYPGVNDWGTNFILVWG